MPGETTPAGAMPAAEGATPPQTTPVSPAPTAPAVAVTSPAMGDPDALGEAGKRALEAERTNRRTAEDRAKTLEKELADLKAAGQSDAEKAIAQAKKDGAAEVTTKWSSQVRRSEVRAALASAGINASVLDLAVHADEFATLKVSDEGSVEGLPEALEAFKKAKPDLFKAPVAAGSADGGVRGQTKTISRDQIKEMAKTPGALTAALEKGELDSVLKPN